MDGSRVCLSATVFLLACSLLAVAQRSTDIIVPPLVNFSGMLRDGNGKALTGIVGVIAESRAFGRSFGGDRGEPNAIQYRLRKINEALRNVDEKARWLAPI